jgi:hypothetical protein
MRDAPVTSRASGSQRRLSLLVVLKYVVVQVQDFVIPATLAWGFKASPSPQQVSLPSCYQLGVNLTCDCFTCCRREYYISVSHLGLMSCCRQCRDASGHCVSRCGRPLCSPDMLGVPTSQSACLCHRLLICKDWGLPA